MIKEVDVKVKEKLIFSHEKEIIPKNRTQTNCGTNWKPKGLWYSFGNDWIDWVKYNMPEWEENYPYTHKIEIDRSKILVLGEDISYLEFEEKYGDYTYCYDSYSWDERKVPRGIKWLKVMLDLRKQDKHGIEIDCPFGPIGSWLRTWDVPSGCIWGKRAIKSIKRIK